MAMFGAEPQFNLNPFTVGFDSNGHVNESSMTGPNAKQLFAVGRTAQALGVAPGTMLNWENLDPAKKAAFAETARQLEIESDTEKRKKLQKTIKVLAAAALAGGAIYAVAGAGGAAGGGAAASGGTSAAGGGGVASGGVGAAGGGTGLAGTSTGFGSSSLGLSGGGAGLAGAGGAAGGTGAAAGGAGLAGTSSGFGASSLGLSGAAGGAGLAGAGASAGGAAAVAPAATSGATGGFWGAAKGVLGNKALMSGLISGLSSAYGQWQQKSLAKDQYKWQSQELERYRQWQADQAEKKRNSPSAQMARALLSFYMPKAIERLGRHGGGDTTALQEAMRNILGQGVPNG